MTPYIDVSHIGNGQSPAVVAYLIVAVAVALVIAVVLTLVQGGLILSRGVFRRGPLLTPAAYQQERTKAKPVATGQFEPDLAWPVYQLRQYEVDYDSVKREYVIARTRMWEWASSIFFKVPTFVWWVTFPVPAITGLVLVFTDILLVPLLVIYALVLWGTSLVGALGHAIGVGVLRTVDKIWSKARGTAASCPACYHVTDRPAYACPGCSRRHHDIRPGRTGMAARRCECGQTLPTTVLRAAWKLTPYCQRCDHELRIGAAVLRDVRIPIFGDPMAGKTRFLYACLASLIGKAKRAGVDFGYPDTESAETANRGLEVISSNSNTGKTSEDLPRALTYRLGSGATATLVHQFDAAGERFRDAGAHDDLGFLGTGQGLIYVVDPFAIRSVRDQLSGNPILESDQVPRRGADADVTYGEVVSRLRDSGIKSKSQRLAVVVSKADLLAEAGVEVPNSSEGLSSWLYEVGLHNLVLAAERDFAEVRYFGVASISAGKVVDSQDPVNPLLWLLQLRSLRSYEPVPVAATTEGVPS